MTLPTVGGMKKDKETHTPMLKVFKDLMQVKNEKNDPERTSLLHKKPYKQDVTAYHHKKLKNMKNEVQCSDTSFSVCGCPRKMHHHSKRHLLCPTIDDSRYMIKEKLKTHHDSSKKNKFDKAKYEKFWKKKDSKVDLRPTVDSDDERDNDDEGKTSVQQQIPSARHKKKKNQRAESTTSNGSCYLQKLLRVVDCKTVLVFVFVAAVIGCGFGYHLKGGDEYPSSRAGILGTARGKVTILRPPLPRGDGFDYDAVQNHRYSDSAMLKDSSRNKYEAGYAGGSGVIRYNRDSYDGGSKLSSDLTSLNLVIDDEKCSQRLRDFYKKLIQLDSDVEKLKMADKADSLYRSKRSLKNKRRKSRNNNKKHNLEILPNASNKTEMNNESFTVENKKDNPENTYAITELKSNGTENNKANENFNVTQVTSDNGIIVKVISEPERKSKCPHLITVDSKSHEKQMKHPFYKHSQRVDDLLDSTQDFNKNSNNLLHNVVTTSKKYLGGKESEDNGKYIIKTETNHEIIDPTDMSMDYYMGLPIMYLNNQKTSRPENEHAPHHKPNMRSLLQADDNYEYVYNDDESVDESNYDKHDNDKRDFKTDGDEMLNNVQDMDKGNQAVETVIDSDLKKTASTSKPFTDLAERQQDLNIPNWKGPMPLYRDEFEEAVLQTLRKNNQTHNANSNDDLDHIGGKISKTRDKEKMTDVRYEGDPSDEHQNSAQAYSDYGVLDNEKKEFKFDKSSRNNAVIGGIMDLSHSKTEHFENIPNDKEKEYIPKKLTRHDFNDDTVMNKNRKTGFKLKSLTQRRLLSVDDDSEKSTNEMKKKIIASKDYAEYPEIYEYSQIPLYDTNLIISTNNSNNNSKSNNSETKGDSKRDIFLSNSKVNLITMENVTYRSEELTIINKTSPVNTDNIDEVINGKKKSKINGISDLWKKFLIGIQNKMNKTDTVGDLNNFIFQNTEAVTPVDNRLLGTPLDFVRTMNESSLNILNSLKMNYTTPVTDYITVANSSAIENTTAVLTKITETNETKAGENRTMVKRNAPIVDSSFIFWNEMSDDDDYGVESDLADYNCTGGVNRERRNKTGCSDWIKNRMMKIKNSMNVFKSDKLASSTADTKATQSTTVTTEATEAAKTEEVTSKGFFKHKSSCKKKKGKRVQRDIEDDITFYTDSNGRNEPTSERSTEDNNEEDDGTVKFSTLTANLREVCRQAERAVEQPLSDVHARVNDPEGGQSETMMAQLVRIMTSLVDEQVQKRTCYKLPEDLRDFLEQLTAPDPEQSTDDEEKPGNDVSSDNKEESRDEVDTTRGATSSITEPSVDYKSNCYDLLREIQDLQNNFDQLSENEKMNLNGVKEYLDNKQLYVLNFLQNFSLQSLNDGDLMRLERDTRLFNHLNVAKRSAFKFIKKSGKKHTKSTPVETQDDIEIINNKNNDNNEQSSNKINSRYAVAKRHKKLSRHKQFRDTSPSREKYRHTSSSREKSRDTLSSREKSREMRLPDAKQFDKRNLRDVYYKAVNERNKKYSTIKMSDRKEF